MNKNLFKNLSSKILHWIGLVGLTFFVVTYSLWKFDFATLGDTLIKLVYFGFISVIAFLLSIKFKGDF